MQYQIITEQADLLINILPANNGFSANMMCFSTPMFGEVLHSMSIYTMPFEVETEKEAIEFCLKRINVPIIKAGYIGSLCN